MESKLFHGDCLEILADIEDRSINLILSDPPYGTTQNKWDSVIDLPRLWGHLKRIISPDGAIVMTASQPFTSTLIMSNQKWFKYEWIWHKNKASGHLNAKKMPMKAHENIVVFGPGRIKYFPQMTSDHKPMNAYYTSHNGRNYGSGKKISGGGTTTRYPRSVQEFAVINNDDTEKIHPTQKPVSLMEYMVKTYSEPGDVVLDFAMGSGSTGVACMNQRRNFIGIEKDEEYFSHAKSWIERIKTDTTPSFPLDEDLFSIPEVP